MVTVSKNTLSQTIWQNFYQLISDNVTSVTVNGKSGPDTKTLNVQKYTNSFPDTELDAVGDYPVIVIYTPEVSYEALTFDKYLVTGTISISVLCPNGEGSTKFKDLINKTIQDNLSDFFDVEVEELFLDDDFNQSFERGKIKLHENQVTWKFEYVFS